MSKRGLEGAKFDLTRIIMSVFPHSRLWVGPSRSVVISGPHIQILDTRFV
jgi:hypothetical protein